MYLQSVSRAAHPRTRWLLGLVLVVGALLSAAVAWQQHRVNQARLDQLVRAETQRIATGAARQVLRMELGLRGARGAALAMGWEAMSREVFLRYSLSRNIDDEFPGALGIGLIRRVARHEEAAFAAAAAADGWPGFAVRSLAPHEGERWVIQYIEPMARNREAVGLDIASEPRRQQAALMALRTGRVTLTEPISLVQTPGGPPRSGFLMLLPVYPLSAVASDEATRVAQALGWTYAVMVIQDVLVNLDIDTTAYHLTIADVAGAGGSVFYASGTAPVHPGPSAQVEVPIAGRTWRVGLTALPALVARQGLPDPVWVGLAGLLASVLVAGALRNHLRAEDHVRELSAERERRAVALQTSRDAVVMVDPQGTVFDWNHGAQALFGYAAREVIGRSALDLLVPPDRLDEVRGLQVRAARGEALPALDTQRLNRQGERIDVSILLVPLRRRDGQYAGLAVSMRDIRAAKQAEREIRQLGDSLQERATALKAAWTDVQITLDALPALVAYWDAASTLVRGNRAWHHQFGASGGAGEPLTAAAVFTALYPPFPGCVSRVLAGEKCLFECTLRVPDTDDVWHAQVELLPDVREAQVVGYHSVLQDVTQQALDKARLAAALRESEAFLATVHTHALVSVTDRAGRILDVNANFCRLAQYSRAELIGQNHRIVNSGRHTQEFWTRMWQTIGRNRPWRGEICNRARDGSLYWVDSMIAPIPGADGRIERFIAIRTDITSRKRLQTELDQARELAEQRERFLREITDKVPLRIAYVDAALRFRFVNQAHCVRFGRPREQIIGHTRAELTGQPIPPEVEGHLAGVLRGEPQHYEYTEQAGEQRVAIEAHLVPDFDGEGAVRGFFTVSADITERHESEQTLRRTMTLLRSVLDASSEVAIIATDAAGLIQLFNRGAERLLGLAAHEAIGRLSHLAFHDRAEVDARRAALGIERGRPVKVAEVFTDPNWLCRPREWTYVRQDGQRVPVSMILTPMSGAGGEVSGYLAVTIDITQRKEFEHRLEQATARAEAANRAKSEFLANMSHEIRSPLNAILGLTYLLLQTALNPEQRAFLGRIKLASDALLLIVNDVLDLSKVEAGELTLSHEPFPLGDTVGDLVAVMGVHAHSKELSVDLVLEPGLPERVVGDSLRLMQVLTNLIANAIKFTERGHVRVHVDWQARSDTRGVARLSVSDTGIGMSEEALGRVFEPFVQADTTTTRRFGGTGLGLSIVRQLVALMDGRLGVQSQPGEGSTFWVEIPFDVAGAAQAPTALERVLRSDALAGKTVLVVDDSDINRDVARRIIERKGARVALADNGAQAVELLRSGVPVVDLVLMDMHMPVMDGFEATRRIRGELNRPALPVLALTAGATTDERAAARAVGVDDFITKPFDPVVLLRHLVNRLGAQDAAGATRSETAPAVPMSVPAPGWPAIEGLDVASTRDRLGQDLALFAHLLRRMFEACGPLAFDNALGHDPTRRQQAIHDVHLLSGNAGTLGMARLHALAVECETCLREGRFDQAGALVEPINAERARLQAACAPFLAEQAAAQTTAETLPLPGADRPIPTVELAALIELLAHRSLRAEAAFDALVPVLKVRLEPAAFQALREAMDSLQFARAAELLSSLASSGLNSRS